MLWKEMTIKWYKRRRLTFKLNYVLLLKVAIISLFSTLLNILNLNIYKNNFNFNNKSFFQENN